ncbi:MAG: AAA family ATPase [Desulfovibrio sp.]|jgi:cobyrinic acid a,c-diamide synthase|nr:AAA family ATPase [Desulfovibrio sp.]
MNATSFLTVTVPRFVVSGLSGGVGKTMVSLGIARSLARSGLALRAFKKGPDYIDAAWLGRAAFSPSANLDPFFSSESQLISLFIKGTRGYDFALVEGNRGLFDGLDIDGSCSSAQLARTLSAPVLLVLDCTKMTRTAAALVKGCLAFEPGLAVGGVILNRTGNERHQTLARRAVEELAGVPVLGALPRRAEAFIAERHMGLAGMDEFGGARASFAASDSACGVAPGAFTEIRAEAAAGLSGASADASLEALADFIEEHLDMGRIRSMAESAPPLTADAPLAVEAISLAADGGAIRPESASFQAESASFQAESASHAAAVRPRIGYVHDAAFWFYYRENLEALIEAGAALVSLSLLDERPWPAVDGLYLGGGLPELHAAALSANPLLREELPALCRAGLPVYAECGGFIALARSVMVGGGSFPMAGVFAVDVELCDKPQGLGYIEAETVADTPFYPRGLRFRGHEFHFSRRSAGDGVFPEEAYALRLLRGKGMGANARGECFDGLTLANTFAAYSHVYAPCLPEWAPAFVGLCRLRRAK